MSDEKEDVKKRPSTEPYKGVRDFYPEDMAVQRYIFDTWAKVAESFGFERYDASILEPSDLYKAKGAENEEMVNEQTYTFTDRGDREVTLRPEMTPSVARMVAGRRRELSLPVRWYSIPNLFRYERTQRGRLREHWQLNTDIFGTYDTNADVEIILLASAILKAFGADEKDFEIRVNDRTKVQSFLKSLGVSEIQITEITRLNDKKGKISPDEYREKLLSITQGETLSESVIAAFDKMSVSTAVTDGLKAYGLENVVFDSYLARGFDYYTGTIFEFFDTNPENRRSLLGGGRYDNLTGLFGGDPIPAVGFGMGDVTMRDFLKTHGLLSNMGEEYNTGPRVYVVNDDGVTTTEAAKYAALIRDHGIKAASNLTNKKLGDQLKHAERISAVFALIVTPTGLELKHISDRAVTKGTFEELVVVIQKR